MSQTLAPVTFLPGLWRSFQPITTPVARPMQPGNYLRAFFGLACLAGILISPILLVISWQK